MPSPIPSDWQYAVNTGGGALSTITVPASGSGGVHHTLLEVKYKLYCVGAPGGLFLPSLVVSETFGPFTLFTWQLMLDMTFSNEVTDTFQISIAAHPNSALTVAFNAASPNLSVGEALQIQGYSS